MEKPPLVVIIGDSGTGKSSLLETLPPERTVIINTENKPLPMRNFEQFKNFYITDWKALSNILDKLASDEKDEKTGLTMKEKYDYVIMDSFTSTVEIVNRYCDKVYNGYEVWAKYNDMITDVIIKMKKLDMQCFVIALPEQKAEQFGETKSYARIKGKELKYGFLEKEVAIVMFTVPDYDQDTGEMKDVFMEYVPNKRNSAKAPRGMFIEKPKNDALFIANKIKEYYNVKK
jgi:hypothetical protein